MGFIMIVFEAVGWNVWCSETALGNKGDTIFFPNNLCRMSALPTALRVHCLLHCECTAYCTVSALTIAL